MIPILIFGVALLTLAIFILARNLGLHWRGALLAGIIALWFWGMAFAAASYNSFCWTSGTSGFVDVIRSAHKAGECLIVCVSVNAVVVPLVILCSIIFFIHRPRTTSLANQSVL